MHLAASVVVLEHCTTTATLSPVHVPQICDRLQLILKEVSSGRTLYAAQAHTHWSLQHTLCISGTHTHWSLQDIVCTSGTHIGHCSTLYAPQTHKLVTAGHCMHLKAHTMVTAAPCMHLTHTHTHTHTPVNAAHCTTCYNAQQCIYVPGITFATNSNNYP